MDDDDAANEVFNMIAAAIRTANLDYPDMADGKQWDQHVKSTEESRHLARAVMERLWAKGYEIGPKANA